MKDRRYATPSTPPQEADSTALATRWLTTAEAAERFNVGRETLRDLARGNLDLPGGPVSIGRKKRLYLRWPPEGIEDWLRAIRARAERPAKPAPPRRQQSPTSPRPATDGGVVDWDAVRRQYREAAKADRARR